MSGGHFNLYGGNVADELCGEWRDEEINELFFDLFGGGWYGYRGQYWTRDENMECEVGPRGGGLFEALDFWLSGDTTEESYRDDVRRFKLKWLSKKTPKNRVEFYQQRFEEYATALAEKLKEEIGEV